LTRRAKQAHNDIIAKTIKLAPEIPERAFRHRMRELQMRFELDELCLLDFRQI